MSKFINIIIEKNKNFININEYRKRFASDAPKESFTFRINPISKLVLEKSAELMEISIGQFINILIDDYVSQVEKSQEKDVENLILINHKNLISRMNDIFNSQDLNKLEVFTLLSFFGIELDDLLNESDLLRKLNSKLLKDICNIFGVSMNWLFDFSNEIYPITTISVNEEGKEEIFFNFIFDDCHENAKNKNQVYFIIDENEMKLFILYEVCMLTNSIQHKKYKLIEVLNVKDDNESWDYRYYIRICIELEKAGFVDCNCIDMDTIAFNKISTGIEFIKQNLLNKRVHWTENNSLKRMIGEFEKEITILSDEQQKRMEKKGAHNA